MLRTRASRREDPLDVHVPDPILRAIGRFSKLGLSSQVVLVNDNVPPTKPRATYEDLLAVPDHLVAEIIDGPLYTSPRPAPRHAMANTALGARRRPQRSTA